MTDDDAVGICECDRSRCVRTLAKGTPAEKRYCECGGVIRMPDEKPAGYDDD